MLRGINGQPFLDLDSYLDIEKLRSLHEGICAGIVKSEKVIGSYGFGVHQASSPGLDMIEAERRFAELPKTHPIRVNAVEFLGDVNKFRQYLKLTLGAYMGFQAIYLRGTPFNKEKNDFNKVTEWLPNSKNFPELTAFVNDLPFVKIGRIIIFLSEHHCPVVTHLDNEVVNRGMKHKNEFIWMRTIQDKSFFIFDDRNNVKHAVNSYSAFFNDHDFHGGDPNPRMTFSIRVDGEFNPEFREKLGINKLEHY